MRLVCDSVTRGRFNNDVVYSVLFTFVTLSMEELMLLKTVSKEKAEYARMVVMMVYQLLTIVHATLAISFSGVWSQVWNGFSGTNMRFLCKFFFVAISYLAAVRWL